MSGRPYAGGADLAAIQDAVAKWEPASCRTVHPGDVAHWLYNGLRRYDLAETCRLWEEDDELEGWGLVFPKWHSLDAKAAPGRGDVLAEALDWCEHTAGAAGDPDDVQADACDCDHERVAVLTARGYQRGKQLYWSTGRWLAGVPAPELPAGFRLRTAAGPEDAAALAAVHAGAFGSEWTAEEYRRYMGSPGYDPGRELVIVAPDGRLAAFCVWWPDHRNAIGLFEPVGTHRDFRRLGLGLALLREGMRRMREGGMAEARVLHEIDNEAATALYRAAGFEPRHAIWDYRLAVGRRPAP